MLSLPKLKNGHKTPIKCADRNSAHPPKRYVGNETLNRDIVGVWRPVSCEGKSSDGQSFLLYGSNPTGKLIYIQDGHMVVILMDSTRSRLLSEDRYLLHFHALIRILGPGRSTASQGK